MPHLRIVLKCCLLLGIFQVACSFTLAAISRSQGIHKFAPPEWTNFHPAQPELFEHGSYFQLTLLDSIINIIFTQTLKSIRILATSYLIRMVSVSLLTIPTRSLRFYNIFNDNSIIDNWILLHTVLFVAHLLWNTNKLIRIRFKSVL